MQTALASDTSLSKLRVAIVHYWFVGRTGGERVVEALVDVFPQADLFALVANPALRRSGLSPHPFALMRRVGFL
jgi:hypothetical protein